MVAVKPEAVANLQSHAPQCVADSNYRQEPRGGEPDARESCRASIQSGSGGWPLRPIGNSGPACLLGYSETAARRPEMGGIAFDVGAGQMRPVGVKWDDGTDAFVFAAIKDTEHKR